MNQLVSVIIPAYNAQEIITSCIKSVLNQTYHNIEIIVIDDGSTDSTLRIVQEYKNGFSINCLRIFHQDNQGPSKARNLGIQQARGEYIAFLDSDDCWVDNKIEEQLKVFEEYKDCVLVGTSTKYQQENVTKYSFISFKRLLYSNRFTTSSVICKKQIVEKILFNEQQKYSEDYRLWLQIAKDNLCILINKRLTIQNVKARFGEKGLSAKLWKMEKGELSNFFFLFKKHEVPKISLIMAIAYSLLKFFRRNCITLLNKW